MNIIAFVVRCLCPGCAGKKTVHKESHAFPSQCVDCKGLGHVEGVVEWKAFENMMLSIINRIPR